MNRLDEIETRHGRDRWKDAVFILGAVLLTALSIGSVTSKARGPSSTTSWSLTVLESNLQVGATR
jgi:hypothetical protein